MELCRVLKKILSPLSVHAVHCDRRLGSRKRARPSFFLKNIRLASVKSTAIDGQVREMELGRVFNKRICLPPTRSTSVDF